MINHVIIRLGEMSDLDTLVQFNMAMARETENRDLDPETVTHGVKTVLMGNAHGFYNVAEYEDQVLGALLITFEWSDWHCARYWWIQSVYVKPEYRQQGVYSRLYMHTKALAKQQPGVCGMRLYADVNNTSAHQTYEKLGMHKTDYVVFEEMLYKQE